MTMGTQFEDEPNDYVAEMHLQLTGKSIDVTDSNRHLWVPAVQELYDNAQRSHMKKYRIAVRRSYFTPK